MNERELKELATSVRKQGHGSTMTDLVYDPVTGEFRQVSSDVVPAQGDVVTEMTREGFAADAASGLVVYVDKEELQAFRASGGTAVPAYAYEWEGEGVVHVHLHPLPHAHGRTASCTVCRGARPGDVATDYVLSVGEADGEVAAELFAAADGYAVPHAVAFVPARAELYSRNKGLLEKDALAGKRALVVGLGSFGSQICVELAKAGVGSFALCDFDRVELHNLSRHIGTTDDLGRLKTDVVHDAILGKNPYASVDRFPVDINADLDFLAREVEKADVVICATDNNRSRFNLAQVLTEHPKTCIYGRAVTRAEGGDVFISRPGGPCYNCLVGNGWFDSSAEEISTVQAGRRAGRIAAYVSDADADAVVQVGLSADIAPICNLMVKLALVELSRGTDAGISVLEPELAFDYYMWANRRERRYANWSPLPEAGNRPTILRWYGARIARRADCTICGEEVVPLE